jgi:hypothetical protein
MPTDIAGSVTPEYTAVIPVPNDGEYANHAALSAALLPIANRAEYLFQLAEGRAFNSPRFTEDWLGMYHDTGASRVHGDSGPWIYDESGAGFALAGGAISSAADCGILLAQNASGSALSMRLRKHGGARLIALKQFSFRLGLTSLANQSFEIGLFNSAGSSVLGSGENAGIGVSYIASLSANIRALGVTGGAYTYTDSGVPMTLNQTLCDILYNGVTWELFIDGAGPFAFAGLPATSTALTPAIRFGSTNTGTRQFFFDMVHARWEVARL